MILRGKYVTDKSLGATFKTPWVDASGLSLVGFHWLSTAGTSPVGAITVEESDDPKIAYEKLQNPTDSTASTAAAVNISASPRVEVVGTGLSVAGANGTVIHVTNPATYVRLVFTRASGTAVGQVWLHGRDTAA